VRKSYVQIDGKLYEKGTEPRPVAPMVQADIKPYRSMIDGSMITSRSQHRDHLRQHNCVEVGNETEHMLKPRQYQDYGEASRKELIRAQVDAMSHAEFKRAKQRDIESVKWNSRGLPQAKD
jgi:hypothetical protein